MCEYLIEISSLFNEYSERLLQITEDDYSQIDSSESSESDSSSDSEEDDINNLKINEQQKTIGNHESKKELKK